MPGPGGIIASNQVPVSAPRDGSMLCLPLRSRATCDHSL